MAKTIQMRRNRKGQFVPKGSSSRKKRARRNPPATAHHATKSRKRTRRHSTVGRPRRRSYRRNPPAERSTMIMGVPIPNLSEVGLIVLGAAAPPALEGFALGMLPPAQAANKTVRMAVQVGSYIAPPLIALTLGGKPAAKQILKGELVSFGLRAVQTLLDKIQNPFVMMGPTVDQGGPIKGYIPGSVAMQRTGMSGRVAGYIGPSPITGQSQLNGRSPMMKRFSRTR